MEAYVLLISGRVQGVGFRWFTEREAASRDVHGYVRNLSDGRVEVFVQGDAESVRRFCDALSAGPRAARVDDVHRQAAKVDPEMSSFQVRFEHS